MKRLFLLTFFLLLVLATLAIPSHKSVVHFDKADLIEQAAPTGECTDCETVKSVCMDMSDMVYQLCKLQETDPTSPVCSLDKNIYYLQCLKNNGCGISPTSTPPGN